MGANSKRIPGTSKTAGRAHEKSSAGRSPLLLNAPNLQGNKLLAQIRRHSGDFQTLRHLWLTRNREQWAGNKAAYRLIGESFLEFSEPLLAQDVFREVLATCSTVRLRQLYALSLLRSGAEQSAAPLLQQLVNERHRDEETLGLWARVEKGLAFSSRHAAERHHHLRQAFKLYKYSFRKTRGYWTGVNAATLALVLGDSKEATTLALRVKAICERKLARRSRGSDAFWALATLGEVALILGKESDAQANYSRALSMGVHRIGDIASMRRNARLVAEAKRMAFPIDRILKVRRVIVFTGETGPSRQGLSLLRNKALDAMRSDIERALAGKPAICFASGACPSEILFLETNHRNRGENYLVLPCPAAQFIQESVRPHGKIWVERFEKMLKSATGVHVLSKSRSSQEPIQIRFTTLLLLGHARLKAAELDTNVEGLAVWDGGKSSIGAASQAVSEWRAHGLSVQTIQPNGTVVSGRSISSHDSVSAKGHQKKLYTPVLRAMLFADAVGFSQLSEAQLPAFFSDFQTVVARLMRKPGCRPEVANTWGDGLYLVFRTVEDAGRFSLELRDRIRQVDWTAAGLPQSLSLRIGLHTGPVYSCRDPITGEPTFIGTNVTRAARLEPITPPGEVYTSADFAALAAAENANEFTCEYKGIIPAVKGYGDFPTYVLKSRATQ